MEKSYYFVRKVNYQSFSKFFEVLCRAIFKSQEYSILRKTFIVAIVTLLLNPTDYLSAQTYTAQNYNLRNGGGMTETNQTGRVSIFRTGSSSVNEIAFHIWGLQNHPDFIVRRPGIGVSYPTFTTPYLQARFIGAGKLEFATSNRGLTNGGQLADLTIMENGNVAIGLANPNSSNKLHVNGSIRANGSLFLGANVENEQRAMYFDIHANSGGYWLGSTDNHPISIGTARRENMQITTEGKVIVRGSSGTASISFENSNKYSLFVQDGILSEDFAIGPRNTWADHVFESDYKLMDLHQLESFINSGKRLPNIPSAQEINKNGYNLHEMNVKFLEKIEELTLYIIDQDKEIKQLKKELETFNEIAEKVAKLEDTLSR